MCLCQIRHAANQNNSIHAHRTPYSHRTRCTSIAPCPYCIENRFRKTVSLSVSSVAVLRFGRFNFKLFLYVRFLLQLVAGQQYGLPNETKKAIIGLPHRSSATVYRQRARSHQTALRRPIAYSTRVHHSLSHTNNTLTNCAHKFLIVNVNVY